MGNSAVPVDQVVHFSSSTPYVAPAAKSTYSAPAAQNTYIAPAGTGVSETQLHGSGIGVNVHANA